MQVKIFDLDFGNLLCIIDNIFRLLCESLIFPLQERLDDWKKSVVQMDKDHAKGRIFSETMQHNCFISDAHGIISLR